MHKCTNCGKLESDVFGKNGKPYCYDCINSLKANGCNMIDEEYIK
jgi:hypothetical protein